MCKTKHASAACDWRSQEHATGKSEAPLSSSAKVGKQLQLCFDEQGHSELQTSSVMFRLFVIFSLLIMFGPQRNRNLGLIISKAAFLVLQTPG